MILTRYEKLEQRIDELQDLVLELDATVTNLEAVLNLMINMEELEEPSN